MNRSSSSEAGSNAISGGMTSSYVRCLCSKLSVVRKAWTDDNPGRRFYGCPNPKWKSCTFFKWFDVEKPYGWQKNSLLEARDLIREQEEELKKLKAMVGHDGKEMESEMLLQMEEENKKLRAMVGRDGKEMESEILLQMEEENKKLRAMVGPDANEMESKMLQLENENKKLKQELAVSYGKEKMGKQFVIISWVGFACVTPVIVNALK
ncbi:unnamed protein product [Brassica oleracea var. botrytis]|uniref:GRF-type domain-containing protein n=4 Tax=Brassica TaxID=3705 RepID=A0A0D3E8Q5_BRAOL|nr:PREDICTED: uncharacterized protein LOC106319158 [Brassica oleracea var. oleracea]KAG2275870.1 hypothetical protein Bca52824_058425 [Brassica carinata]VDD31264.1 unnamed protein product [Brassica oleracea]